MTSIKSRSRRLAPESIASIISALLLAVALILTSINASNQHDRDARRADRAAAALRHNAQVAQRARDATTAQLGQLQFQVGDLTINLKRAQDINANLAEEVRTLAESSGLTPAQATQAIEVSTTARTPAAAGQTIRTYVPVAVPGPVPANASIPVPVLPNVSVAPVATIPPIIVVVSPPPPTKSGGQAPASGTQPQPAPGSSQTFFAPAQTFSAPFPIAGSSGGMAPPVVVEPTVAPTVAPNASSGAPSAGLPASQGPSGAPQPPEIMPAVPGSGPGLRAPSGLSPGPFTSAIG